MGLCNNAARLPCTMVEPAAVKWPHNTPPHGNEYIQVWAALAPLRDESLADLPGFDAAVREFVCVSMSITYQAIPLPHLRESLSLEGAELTTFIKARGWNVEGDVVRVKLNDDNQAKPKKPDEGGAIRFDQMTKILASVV